MPSRVQDDSGFSAVELVVAACLMLVAMGTVFQLMHPAHGAFRTESETADLQQRLRVAADVLSREIQMAGGGSSQGDHAGPLNAYFAAILPFRQGRRHPDPPGTYKTDTITVLHVAAGAAQTTIAQPLQAQAGAVQVDAGPGCPINEPVCGFKRGTDLLVFDDTGSYDTFTVDSVQNASLILQHNMQDSGKTYSAHVSKIVEVASRTFYLKVDPTTDAYQLMRYDGASGADVPVVDHVVELSFEYFGDPRPPGLRKPLTDAVGPWTTYGPKPPPSGQQTTAYPPGENCAFMLDGSSTPTPRLDDLGPNGQSWTPLTPSQLVDGPWCPDSANPNRFDADLLRVRTVVVTIRVEAAASSLRGPAGTLFARGGTAREARRLVPDQEARFEIAPRNLNMGR